MLVSSVSRRWRVVNVQESCAFDTDDLHGLATWRRHGVVHQVDLLDKPNALRDAVVEHFRTHGGTLEVRIQLCTDIAA